MLSRAINDYRMSKTESKIIDINVAAEIGKVHTSYTSHLTPHKSDLLSCQQNPPISLIIIMEKRKAEAIWTRCAPRTSRLMRTLQDRNGGGGQKEARSERQ